MQDSYFSWQYWVSIVSLVVQGISLIAIIRPISEARKLIRGGATNILDGGDVSGQSDTQDISDVAHFLLKQAASPYLAVVAIILSLTLQLIVAIVP